MGITVPPKWRGADRFFDEASGERETHRKKNTGNYRKKNTRDYNNTAGGLAELYVTMSVLLWFFQIPLCIRSCDFFAAHP